MTREGRVEDGRDRVYIRPGTDRDRDRPAPLDAVTMPRGDGRFVQVRTSLHNGHQVRVLIILTGVIYLHRFV